MPVKTERLLTLSEDINSSTKEFTNPVDAVGVIPASFCRNFRATCIAASDTLSSAKKLLNHAKNGIKNIIRWRTSSIAVPLAEIMEYC
jgi:hypothetical protein